MRAHYGVMLMHGTARAVWHVSSNTSFQLSESRSVRAPMHEHRCLPWRRMLTIGRLRRVLTLPPNAGAITLHIARGALEAFGCELKLDFCANLPTSVRPLSCVVARFGQKVSVAEQFVRSDGSNNLIARSVMLLPHIARRAGHSPVAGRESPHRLSRSPAAQFRETWSLN